MTDLVVTPHPLTLKDRRVAIGVELLPGETLAEFLLRAEVPIGEPGWEVRIGGALVHRLMWDRTRPRHGQLIECHRPAGKKVIAIVAIVFIAWVTMGGGLAAMGIGAQAGMGASAIAASGVSGLAGALGMSAGFAAMAVNLGAYMLGAIIVSKVLGPSKARAPQYAEVKQAYSVSGGRNATRPFEPLGLVFGEVRVVPDYATNPYSFFESNEQYQYVRLHAGINCGAVSDLKIGSTSIDTYTDVTVTQSGFPGMTTQLQEWANVDTVAGGTLDAPTAPGPYVVRTSSAGAVRLAVDVVAQLYKMKSNGGMDSATVVYSAERRLLPSGAWVPFRGVGANETLTSKETKPVRATLLSDVLPAGQYEVRLRKLTANVSTTKESNTLEFGSLKSYQEDSTDYTSHPQVGIRIKASGQLNGALDEVNWLATAAATPVWNGAAWVTQATRNPGAQMLQFARGIFDADGRLMAGLGLPDSQIDIEGLKAFMVHCSTKGYVFDHWFTSMVSCQDVLEAMAAAGMGSLSYHPGKLSVVWLAEGQPIEGVVNMGNIKASSFRVDYTTRESAEELEVAWTDRDLGWLPATVRVKAPGVTMPRETARYAPLGITTQAGGLRTARLAMAQNIYQRKSVTWEMDLEHLTFRRYSLVRLSHDLTRWGFSGRLHAASIVAGKVVLTLDDTVLYSPTALQRYVGVRVPGDQGYRIFSVQGFAADTHTLTLNEAWPSGVPFPGSSSDNPAHDYLWIFDFQAQPGVRLRVISIEPTSNLGGAQITAVPEPDEFWNYFNTGEYVVPASSAPAQILSVSNLRVTQARVDLSYDATTELTITFDSSGPYDHAQIWGGPDGSELEYLGSTLTTRFSPWRVPNDGIVDIEVRPFDGLGRAGVVGATSHNVTINEVVATSKLLKLTSSSQVFQINKAGSATPSAITLTASGQNLTGSPTFAVTTGTATLTGSGTSRTLSFANMTTDVVTVTVTWDGLTDEITIIKLREGSDAFNGLLTNESANVAADPAGVVGSFAGTGGDFRVWQGTTELTSGVAFSVASSTGVTIAINATTGVYSITAMSADQGSAVLRAVIGSVTIDKVYNISKSRAGLDGADARTLSLAATSQVFQINKAGTASPSSITLSAIGQGLTGSPTFAVSLGTATLTGTGTTRSLAYGNMTSDVVTITCSWDGLTDTITIVKIREGSDAYNAVLTNESANVAADALGAVASYAGAGGDFRVWLGATELTSGVAYSVFSSTGVTIAINATTGVYSVSAMSADQGSAVLRAVIGSVTIDKVYNISKSRAGEDGTDAQVLSLTATSYLFQVNKAGTATPSSITVSAAAQGLAGSPSFSVTSGTATLTGTGNSRTLAYGNMTSDVVTISCTWDGEVDTITLIKVREGSDAYNVILENESAVVAADAAGTVASFAGAGGHMRVWQGATELTSGVTYSLVSSSGVTTSINATSGVFSVTAMSADDGTATFRATIGSQTWDKVYNISKARRGVDGQTAVSSSLSRYAIALPADSTGLVSSYSGASSTVTIKVGQTDDTPSWSKAVTATSGITASLSGATVSITAMNTSLNSGQVTLTCSKAGYPDEVLQIDVSKAKSATPASGPNTSIGTLFSGIGAVAPTDAIAGIRLNTDGSISQRNAAGSWVSHPVNWYAPVTTGIGSGYWVRADLVNGDTPGSGTLKTWQALSSARNWSLSATSDGEIRECLLLMSISSNSGGTAVVSTFYIKLFAESAV